MLAMLVFWAFQTCPLNTFIIAFGNVAFELVIIAIKDNGIPDNPVSLIRGYPSPSKFDSIISVIIIFVENAVQDEILVADLGGMGGMGSGKKG